MREEHLLAYLKTNCAGRKCTVKSAALEGALHLSGNELRRQINRLRRRGIPIGSSREGYFYAQTAGEVYATIRQLKGMAAGLESAIHGLEQSLDAFGAAQGGDTD